MLGKFCRRRFCFSRGPAFQHRHHGDQCSRHGRLGNTEIIERGRSQTDNTNKGTSTQTFHDVRLRSGKPTRFCPGLQGKAREQQPGADKEEQTCQTTFDKNFHILIVRALKPLSGVVPLIRH